MGLFDAIGDFLGVPGSQMIQPIASAASGLFNNASASDRQEAAQEFSAQQYATRYQTTVKDMEAAGLNPMLAYSNGPGNAPTSSAASSPGMPDLGQSFGAAKINAAQVDLLQAQASEARASAWQKMDQSELMKSQVREIQQKLENQYWASDVERLKAVARELMSQYDLNMQKGESEKQARNLMWFQAQKLNEETGLLKLDKKAAEDFANMGRGFGQMKPAFDVLLSILGLMRPHGGGITINK